MRANNTGVVCEGRYISGTETGTRKQYVAVRVRRDKRLESAWYRPSCSFLYDRTMCDTRCPSRRVNVPEGSYTDIDVRILQYILYRQIQIDIS